MKKQFIFFVVMIDCILSVSCECSTMHLVDSSFLDAGNTAPDFNLKDVDGRDISLSAYRGKLVLLKFRATWCDACREMVPELVKLKNTYRDSEVVIFGVSRDNTADTSATLVKFSNDHNINYTVLIGDRDIQKTYNVPSTFIIDRQGVIVDRVMGYQSNLEDHVAEHLGETT